MGLRRFRARPPRAGSVIAAPDMLGSLLTFRFAVLISPPALLRAQGRARQ